MKRIMVIGSSGSGKSTAARLIGEKLDLPVFHIDRDVYWLPGWVERPRDEQVRRVEEIAAQEAWVFEGSNSSTFHIRAARAEMLIWLDPPLPLRLFRVIRRAVLGRGQTRPDMAEGCEERLSMLPGFLWFIVSTWRSSKRRTRSFFSAAPMEKHRFTSARQINDFIKTLTAEDRG